MLLPDVNILLYAYNSDARENAVMRGWWESSLQRQLTIGLPWVVILGFVRLITNRKMYPMPMHVQESLGHVRSWLARPNVQILAPGERHAEILFGLLEHLGIAGNLTTDAHLAALAIEYHAELVSADVEFARFPGLRWFNPLSSKK
jgi:hypothetical protein